MQDISEFAQIEQEVLEWANDTVKAKGAKFSALTKQTQYKIALYILHLKKTVDEGAEQHTEEVADGATDAEAQGDTPNIPPTLNHDNLSSDSAVPANDDPANVEAVTDAEQNPATDNIEEETIKIEEETIPPRKIPRGLKFYHEGYDAQKAYDIYLNTLGESRGTVIDFRSGKESREAAFAYWLMESI